MKDKRDDNLQVQLKLAYFAMAEENWEEAWEIFDRILAEHPDEEDAILGRKLAERSLQKSSPMDAVKLSEVPALNLQPLRDPTQDQPEWAEMLSRCLAQREWSRAKEMADLVVELAPREPLAYLYRMMAKFEISTIRSLAHYAGRFQGHSDYEAAKACADENFREWLELETGEPAYTPPVPEVEYMVRHENLLSLWWGFALS